MAGGFSQRDVNQAKRSMQYPRGNSGTGANYTANAKRVRKHNRKGGIIASIPGEPRRRGRGGRRL